jgi:hypothetical protein
MVVHVEDEVLAHDSQANQGDVRPRRRMEELSSATDCARHGSTYFPSVAIVQMGKIVFNYSVGWKPVSVQLATAAALDLPSLNES